MSMESINQSITDGLDIQENLLDAAKKTASVATIESQVVIEQFSSQFNKIIDNMIETFSKHYGNFMTITKDSINDILKTHYKYKQPQFVQLYQQLDQMNQLQKVKKMKDFVNDKMISGVKPMNVSEIKGGGNNSTNNSTDFMKYVYTKKPIWFTKKDMIWN